MAVDVEIVKEVQAAIQEGSPERRSKILQRVTDLFVLGSRRYSDDEISVFDDVLLCLIQEIEISARTLLAVRLASLPEGPPQTVRKLAGDTSIQVAGPVLRLSECLDEAALIDIAQRFGQEHLFAISERSRLGQSVTDVLLQRGNRRVAFRLATNSGAKFSDNGFANLVRRAQGDNWLTTAVGQRPDLPQGIYLELVARASAEVRQKLESAHPEFKTEVRQAVAEVTSRLRAGAPKQSDDSSIQQAIRALAQSGELTDERLGQFAKSRSFEETTIALALMADLPVEFMREVMLEKRSEIILIIAKTIGLSWPTLKCILLLRAGKAGFSRHELEEHHASFRRLRSRTANEIVRFYRAHSNLRSSNTVH